VPVENTLRWARPSAARVHLLDTEHRMHEVIPELEQLFAVFLERIAG
jgi:hypothetical protein